MSHTFLPLLSLCVSLLLSFCLWISLTIAFILINTESTQNLYTHTRTVRVMKFVWRVVFYRVRNTVKLGAHFSDVSSVSSPGVHTCSDICIASLANVFLFSNKKAASHLFICSINICSASLCAPQKSTVARCLDVMLLF